MNSNRKRRAAVLTLASAVGWVGAAACGSTVGSESQYLIQQGEATPQVGSLRLKLELASGAQIEEVVYAIVGNDITPITGTIDVSAIGSTASLHVGQLPAGKDYAIEVMAESDDGKVTCSGGADFDVVAGQTTAVSLVLNCRAEDVGGSIDIIVTFNRCPVVNEFIVSPLGTRYGNTINLRSGASDADGNELSYAWTSEPAESWFADAAAPVTTFTCGLGVDYELVLTVSDGRCETDVSVPVTCFPPDCSNGVVDQGEECDDGNLNVCDGCDASCRVEACGNGRVDCDEECDGGSNCDEQCQLVECGDGRVNGDEECDDGNLLGCDGCSDGCLAEACGNGVVDCQEDCDGGPACSLECKFVPQCGDGLECDGGSGCDNQCQLIVCGDGVIAGGEHCDDGNLDAGDGCSTSCTLE